VFAIFSVLRPRLTSFFFCLHALPFFDFVSLALLWYLLIFLLLLFLFPFLLLSFFRGLSRTLVLLRLFRFSVLGIFFSNSLFFSNKTERKFLTHLAQIQSVDCGKRKSEKQSNGAIDHESRDWFSVMNDFSQKTEQ